MSAADSKESPQIHARVERSDFRIPVEQEGLALKEFAQSPLPRLAPARMINRRIHIRIKPILLRSQLIPRCFGLPFGELNADDGLDALKTILPRDGQTQGRAVLIGEHSPVEPHGEEGER